MLTKMAEICCYSVRYGKCEWGVCLWGNPVYRSW